MSSAIANSMDRLRKMFQAIGTLLVAVIIDFTIFVLFFPMMDALMPEMNLGKAIITGGGYVVMFIITFVLPIAIIFDKA